MRCCVCGYPLLNPHFLPSACSHPTTAHYNALGRHGLVQVEAPIRLTVEVADPAPQVTEEQAAPPPEVPQDPEPVEEAETVPERHRKTKR